MNIKQLIEERQDNPLYNTSYPLSPKDWEEYRVAGSLPFKEEKEIAFYVHVPFCLSPCKFCEYVKYPLPNEAMQHRYLDIVENDMAHFFKEHTNFIVNGFDIGGGTPTSLCHSAFQRLVGLQKTVLEKYEKTPDFRPSIEATFASIDEKKIQMIREAGFSRISFGLQNVNPKFLSRHHRELVPRQQMTDVFDLCRRYDVEVLNLDLMYGFPNQTDNDLDTTMCIAHRLNPEHLTVYELRTNMLPKFAIQNASGRFCQYTQLYNKILQYGYNMLWGSNTASRIGDDGLSSYLRHRMTGNGSYKGFGIAAQSKSKQGLSYNIGKCRRTLEQCLEQGSFEYGGDTYLLPPCEMLAKYIAICGYNGRFRLSKMQEILQADPLEIFHDEFDYLTGNQYVQIMDDVVSLTPQGYFHYGAILSLFYPTHV